MNDSVGLKIVVEKDITDEELIERFEDYTRDKFMNIWVCLRCDNIYTDHSTLRCPRCDSDDISEFWELNRVHEFGVNSKI